MPVTGQKQSLQINQNTGQYIRVEQSNLMQMSQPELDSLILEVERTKLFNRLFKEEKIIRYNRFNKADISRKFYTLDESVISGTQSPEIEILLLDKKRIIECIRELGLEKFKRYFLLPEDGLSESEIAARCGLSVSRVCEINNLVNDIAVMDEFYSLSSLNSNDINYTKIALIEMDKNGFRVSYFLNSMARGQYIIDYEKFEQSELKKGMNAGEIRDVRALFKKLEMLNRCKETLHLILDNAIEKQAAYLESGNAKELLPLSQKELAVKIGVHPGTLSRAIRYRTIEIPCGKEITLKSLFPNPRKFRMMVLKDAVGSEEGAYSDAKIQKKLAEEYGINISRRTVANIRKELKIPAGGAR